MAYYRQLGPVPRQRHTLFKDDELKDQLGD